MQTIRTPDGQVFKFPDTMSRAQIAEALKRRLGNQSTQPNQQPVAGDTSMGTAFNIGDAQAMSGGARGMATLNRLAENSFIGKFQKAARDYAVNPIREYVGLDPLDTDAINKAETDRLNKAADAAQAEADRIAEETNFQNLTTADIKDIPSFVNFVLQKTAQSAPQMAASIGSFGYATYPFSVGGLADDQEGLEGKTQEEKDRAAATGGLVMTALENLGLSRLLPKNATQGIIGGIADGVISEGVTEGLQELISIGVQHSAGKEFTQEEILERLKESIAAGSAAGGTIKAGTSSIAKTKNIFTGEGKVTNPADMDPESAAAAGAFARLLRQIANANNYDLGDVGASSDYGARATIDKAHVQLSEALKDVFQDLSELVTPDKQKTFQQNRDRVLAQAAYREAKNKTKSTVGQQELDAMRRLVGNTAEGQEAINLMLQLNQMTELHNAGYKGGLSRFTDVFNPVDQNINSYDGASRVVTGTLSPLFTAGTAYSTGGASLIPQAALFGTGRAVDKMTGRRSTVDRYVRQNEGNSPDLPEPTAPSLVGTQNLKDQLAQDEALRNEAQQRQLNLQFAQSNAAPTQGSPQYTLEDATGLSRAKVAQVLRILKGQNKNPALTRAIADYERSVAQGGIIDDKMLSPLIRAVKEFQEANTDYVPIDFVPNSLSRPELAQFPTPDQKVQLDAQGIATPEVQSEAPAQPQGGDEFGPQFTTPQNYNRGIQDNLQFNRELQDGAALDNSISRVDRGRIITSLENLTQNLGSSPVDTVQTEIQKLTDAGVPQEAIDTHVQPYVDRVISQQRRNTPKMAMAPQEDAPAVDPKKPQAPLLSPDQIPTQTRKIYKLMKVQKSRPNEVLPLFAKSGGHKGPPSGYNFNKWYASEFKRPKLGAGLLAPRSGIHGVNLPVFDQGKAKVKGEQRVWVEAEIPSINPETQAQSDNSFNPKRKANDGILNRVLDPNESYDYKTNPNASNDAGGWPIAGSVKILRIVPDNEIAQVLRDNGLDHQVDNSFTGIDAAKAQELMQPATPVRMAMAPQEDAPVFRGETTNILMPNTLSSVFEFAKNSNFRKGRDFKIALQEAALKAQKEEGIDLSELSEENVNRLADYVVADALTALQDNANAIGWYDRTVTDALNTLSEIYPEVQTNPVNKLQFIWALAVTSNGTKVDKNFELAANAYDTLQRTGRFPTNIGIGDAARAINSGLAQYHTMLDKFNGDHKQLETFMNSQQTVRDLEKTYNVDISGEGKDTLVRGASIVGAKIGNGFFSNLYGNFDALTMDRWLMRTVGRHRGTLIKINEPMIKKKQGEIKSIISNMNPAQLKEFRAYVKPSGVKVGKSMSKQNINEIAAYIAHKSTSKPWREGLNAISNDLRKSANGLAGYRDGQVEMPAGAKERNFIRSVFSQALERLNSDPAVTRASNTGLTMSDLQALLWYPEKRLYDSSKAPEGQDSRGYADDEAPDYANAARKLVEARAAMAGQGGLGFTRAAGDGRRGTTSPNARPALAPVQDNVAGVLAQRIEGGPTRRTPVPSSSDVKAASKPVKSLITINDPDGEFPDGIKDLKGVRMLAEATGVALNMYNQHKDMVENTGREGNYLGIFQPFGPNNNGTPTASAMNPVRSDPDVGDISDFDSYIIALHEVAHRVADMPMDDIERDDYGTFNKRNPMTGRFDEVRPRTFEFMIANMILNKKGTKEEKAFVKKVMNEIKYMQDQGYFSEGGGRILQYTRYKGGAQTPVAERRNTPYYKYIRGASEFAVDPIVFYAREPKRMKREFPATASLIRNFFKDSTKVQFFSHPLAMAIAAVLAMMMKAEQEEEQMNQMPAGVLNQPMPMGALSQA